MVSMSEAATTHKCLRLCGALMRSTKIETLKPEEAPMTIQVLIKNNYGNQVVYPTCEVGETFALIAGTKTLTDETRALMKRLGYQFEAKAVEL
jgi:hypothetical protein